MTVSLLFILSLLGAVLNAWHVRWCWPIWLVANAGWVAHNLSIGEYHQAALYALYAVLAVVGWKQWGKR